MTAPCPSIATHNNPFILSEAVLSEPFQKDNITGELSPNTLPLHEQGAHTFFVAVPTKNSHTDFIPISSLKSKMPPIRPIHYFDR